jgi:hypothetical protein
MSDRDWVEWHSDYDRPGTALHGRLLAVREQLLQALDRLPAGPVRVVSLCAGQGRDLLPVLAGHPRRDDVTARLVELDPRNVEYARDLARRAGLGRVEVVAADASLTDVYQGAVPADLVVACGVFGNITDADVRRTISYLPQLCAPDATVIWTRGRWEPDLTPSICHWFEEDGFDLVTLVPPPGPADFGVGVHRYGGDERALRTGEQMFQFIGRHVLRAGSTGQETT